MRTSVKVELFWEFCSQRRLEITGKRDQLQFEIKEAYPFCISRCNQSLFRFNLSKTANTLVDFQANAFRWMSPSGPNHLQRAECVRTKS